MQSHDMAEKIKIFVEGEEIPGLVKFSEIVVEVGTLEVPEFKKTRLISNGIDKIPVIEATFKLPRNSPTRKKLMDWKFNNEVHDISKVRTDAHGIEFARTLLPGCECIKYHEPEVDLANPTYAQMQTKFVPWDIIPLE